MTYRRIPTGDGSSMPWGITGLAWRLRYKKTGREDLLVAASIVEAYEYLVLGVSLKEATRRLSIMRTQIEQQRDNFKRDYEQRAKHDLI